MNWYEPIEEQTFPWSYEGVTIVGFLHAMRKLGLI